MNLFCEPVNFRGIFTFQQRSKIAVDEVSRREMVFAAPTRRARGFADPGDPIVRVDTHKQERRDSVISSRAADGAPGMKRDLNRNGLNTRDLHLKVAPHPYVNQI